VKTLAAFGFALQPPIKCEQKSTRCKTSDSSCAARTSASSGPSRAWQDTPRLAVTAAESAKATNRLARSSEDPHPPGVAPSRRDRPSAGDPERGGFFLQLISRRYGNAATRAHVHHGVRGVGLHPQRRAHSRHAAQQAAPPLPHPEHPGQQLPHVPPLALRGAAVKRGYSPCLLTKAATLKKARPASVFDSIIEVTALRARFRDLRVRRAKESAALGNGTGSTTNSSSCSATIRTLGGWLTHLGDPASLRSDGLKSPARRRERHPARRGFGGVFPGRWRRPPRAA